MNFDDPKITAYALGELENAEDRAAIEELLREHPELSAEVEETRAVADFLRRELPAEDEPALTSEQREQVLATAAYPVLTEHPSSQGADGHSKVIPMPLWRRHWIPSAVAATVVLSSGIVTLWQIQQPRFLEVPVSTGATASESRAVARSSSVGQESVKQEPQPEALPSLIERDESVMEESVTALGTEQKSSPPPAAAPLTRSAGTRGVPAEPSAEVRNDFALAPLGNEPAAAPAPAKATRGRMDPAPTSLAPSAAPPQEVAVLFEAAPSRAKNVQEGEAELSYRFTRSGGSRGAETALADQYFMRGVPGTVMDLAQIEPSSTESYDSITDNAFLNVSDNPLSTFSIDVDTASYSNVRRFLTNNQRPPKGAVRIEEMVNYFPYAYPQPEGDDPFSCTLEVAPCPWKPEHRLVRVGLKGREIAKEQLPPSNLVFLLDVSGSMDSPNKLPLVKQCMEQLIRELREQDTVGIVVYAGASGVVLEPTSDKGAIRAAIEGLRPDGSTNGAAGIQAAYRLAQRAFKKDGNNRVVLASDGDFNVGLTNHSELVDLIQEKAKSGVFLSVLGFGMGNMKDSTMEKLADKGNGNYAYIDSLREGRKVLVEQMAGTLFTIAKDVKIQVEFNPSQVGAYRLIGYENRILAKEDFNDDKKDAGEIGAGHTVTALYEVVPAGQPSPVTTSVDPLKYQKTASSAAAPAQQVGSIDQRTKASPELLTLKLRFKQPTGDTSTLREFPLTDAGQTLEKSSTDFRWASAVASFGMLLRDSPHRGNATWESVAELAKQGKGADAGGYRAEFIELIDEAKRLVPVTPVAKPEAPKTGKAASIVVPEFDVTDLPFLDAIDQLSKKSRELDPEKKGVSLVFAGSSNAGQTKISLRMRDTTVLEIAKAVASTLGLELQEQGDILILRAKQ